MPLTNKIFTPTMFAFITRIIRANNYFECVIKEVSVLSLCISFHLKEIHFVVRLMRRYNYREIMKNMIVFLSVCCSLK